MKFEIVGAISRKQKYTIMCLLNKVVSVLHPPDNVECSEYRSSKKCCTCTATNIDNVQRSSCYGDDPAEEEKSKTTSHSYIKIKDRIP